MVRALKRELSLARSAFRSGVGRCCRLLFGFHRELFPHPPRRSRDQRELILRVTAFFLTPSISAIFPVRRVFRVRAVYLTLEDHMRNVLADVSFEYEGTCVAEEFYEGTS